MIEGKRAVSHTSVFALRRPYGSQYAAHYQRNCTCASRVSPHSAPTSACHSEGRRDSCNGCVPCILADSSARDAFAPNAAAAENPVQGEHERPPPPSTCCGTTTTDRMATCHAVDLAAQPPQPEWSPRRPSDRWQHAPPIRHMYSTVYILMRLLVFHAKRRRQSRRLPDTWRRLAPYHSPAEAAQPPQPEYRTPRPSERKHHAPPSIRHIPPTVYTPMRILVFHGWRRRTVSSTV
jgi:hypothetical protein